ncbi:glucan 1,3-beta-glucosidase [Kwoniella mangroviensis CBS 8886]|nr:glucan 1,3-beta-glucosidase [Kwoniella mangroviensis CBS 8886]
MPLMSDNTGTARPFASNYARQNIPSEEYYPMTDKSEGFTQTSPRGRGGKRKWFIIGGIVGMLALIGIIVGVVVSQVNKNNNNNNNSSNSSNSGSGNSTTTIKNENDPSDFDKDSRLHQSFWGFAYTPQDALLPWCGASQNNVTRDIQLLSQLTTRLRLYGANCNQSALVLQAIQDTKVDMTVWLGIYVDSNEEAYNDQVKAVEDALKTYGTDHVSGITVGNEYILNTAGTDSTTSSIYLSASKTITDKITEVKSAIAGLGLSKTLPVGTSDAGSVMSKTLGEGIDYFMANVHPWFGSVSIDDAAQWTWDFFQDFDVEPASLASNKPDVYIAETGWPTESMNATESNSGFGGPKGEASLANLQTFLDTYVCQANANGTEYFYFEAFDEPWKAQYGGVEPFWGLFDKDRTLKDVTIPTCS